VTSLAPVFMVVLITNARPSITYLSFFFYVPTTTEIYTLSLHDALPIYDRGCLPARAPPHDPSLLPVHAGRRAKRTRQRPRRSPRSEEHTSELQSRENLVCRLLLEKKKKRTQQQRS